MHRNRPDRQTPRPLSALMLIAGTVLVAVYGMIAIEGNAARGAEALNTGTMTPFVFKRPPGPMPEIAFKDGEGNPLTLENWRGKVVLLNLWASWCAPCLAEMPTLGRLNQAFPEEPFEVVAISVDRKGRDTAAKFLKRTGAQSLKLYIDQTSKILRDLNAIGLPTTLLLGRDGKVLGRMAGPAEWDSEEARAVIQAALDGTLETAGK